MCLGCRAKKVTRNTTVSCKHIYNELVSLDLRTLELFQKTKTNELLLINKQLRNWINNINHSCPPEEDLNLIKEILNTHEHPIN